MEVDKRTVSGQELKQRLVSSGLFYTSDAADDDRGNGQQGRIEDGII